MEPGPPEVSDRPAVRPTVCLSMIVRDEAHVVAETLAAVASHLDHWVVVDTGSTDGTQDVVRAFFAEAGIAGELHERPWRDFGTNRTEALALAAGKADYTWVIDADDLVVGDLDLSGLTADAYAVRYGPDFVFWRTQIFRSALTWRYEGVLHEYPVCDEPGVRIERLEGDHHFVWRTLGDRSRAADKFERDVAVLTAAHEADPENARTVFYLAQSLRDAGRPVEAAHLFGRRAAMGGWDEEVYVARLERARCLERAGAAWSEVQAAHLEAWNGRPQRAEALHELARHHRLAGDWAAGHLFATRGLELALPDDALFVDTTVHRWRLADEAAICAYYLGRPEESLALNRRLLAEGHLPDEERPRVEGNLVFALDALAARPVEHRPDLVVERVALAADRVAGRRPPGEVTLTITAGRRRALLEQTVDSFLACCDDVDRIDRWICIDDGSDPTDRVALADRYPFIEFIWKDAADAGHARSLNRLRDLVDTPWWLHLEDDWRFVVPGPHITRAIEILDDDPALGQVLFNRCYAETPADLDLSGGSIHHTPSGARYWRQEHLEGDAFAAHLAALPPGGRSNAWWPHYSLRPALLRTASVLAVGPYDEAADHVELDFARRYVAAGLRSAAFDEVTCVHTGPLTSERGPQREPNAYDLAGTDQFGAATPGPPYRVRPLSFWATAEELVQRLEDRSEGGGRWGDVVLTAAADPDYWVVLSHPGTPVDPDDVPDPARTILVPTEPSEGTAAWTGHEAWTRPDPARFLQVRDRRRFPPVADWHLSAHATALDTAPAVKTADLSAVVSGKHHDPGHRLRVAFVRHLEEHGVPIDVYGFDNTHGFGGYRGALPVGAKDDGIVPYRYTLAAENHAEPGYVTEKLYDAVLGEAVAFYWGCPDVERHLDPRCVIRLPLDDLDASREIVVQALASDEWSARIDAIRAERRRILQEAHLFPVLDRVVRGHRALLGADLRVVNLDRRPDRLAAFDQRFRAAAGDEVTDRVRRHPAVDGQAIELTPEVRHLFRGNDHDYRRGIVGCALSHLDLWRQVAAGDRPAVVFEDDAEPVVGLGGLLVELFARLGEVEPVPGVVLVGAHRYEPDPAATVSPPGRAVDVVALDVDNYLGGTFGYVVTPTGARALLALADRHGVQQGIDWFLRTHAAAVGVARMLPDLVTSELAWPGRSGDSDIQHDLTRLTS